MPDDLIPPAPLPEDIATALQRARAQSGFRAPVFFFPSVTSTNDVAARLAGGASDMTTVVADLQTAGRGRLGRTWFSPPGAGLYATVVLRPQAARGTIFLAPVVTLTAGVAIAEAVRACTHLPVDIKWPNDLVIGRRKLAGILTEAAGGAALTSVVVGFGINLRSAAYPPDIGDRATSIEAELGRPADRGALLVDCLVSLATWNDKLRSGNADDVLERWRTLSPSSRGARVAWTTSSGSTEGITEGIDTDGALLVRTGGRIERIIAGEVRWL